MYRDLKKKNTKQTVHSLAITISNRKYVHTSLSNETFQLKTTAFKKVDSKFSKSSQEGSNEASSSNFARIVYSTHVDMELNILQIELKFNELSEPT